MARFICAIVFLALCSATVRPGNLTCPVPCQCQNSTVSCDGCPNSYVVVSKSLDHLLVRGCKDVEYLLRLHQRPNGTGLNKLEIRDGSVKQPEDYIYSDYDIKSLILTNDSIAKVKGGTRGSNLTLLDLSHNEIETIDNRTFVNLNQLMYLDLSDNRISNVDDGCFEGLGKLLQLDLSTNNLTLLSESIFLPLTSLQQLNMSTNRLQALSERSFSSLLMLQQLDISYNRLKSVAPGTLQFLPNLAKLVMTDNPQLRPDAQIFVGTGRRLQQVDASRTGLSQVPEALTHSVRYLTLAGNQIASVRCGDLDSYPLLQMLDFTDNIIVDIEDDALGRLELLSQLYLNRNRLQSVPKMLPDKLSYLSLDNNSIGNLTIMDFISLGGLKMLILSNNNISFIQENAFIQLVSLEVLDLSNNPLKVLTPNTFSGPISLKDLRIAHVNATPPAKDISFPVPSPEGIENLHLEYSPGLTRQLMADTAALAAMTRLQHLDVRYSNVTIIRSDLLHFLPELKILRLEGNRLDCGGLNWLGDWMRENPNDYERVECFSPNSSIGKLVKDLPPSIIPNPTKPMHISVESKTEATIVEKNISSSENNTSLMSPVYSAKKMDGRSKLLQIFSEWSQEPYNQRYEAGDVKQKAQIVPPCISTGSLNGTENKTKCPQLPAAPVEHSTKPSRFMYRKIGNDVESQTTEYEANTTYEDANMTMVVGNVSEYRTSRFSSEPGNGGMGALAAAGVLAAIGAALAAAWTSRRRPRPRNHQDLMEVPTIAAVGELW